MIGKICTGHYFPKETPFEEACIDLAVPDGSKVFTQLIRLIERRDGGHHVDNGLCTEFGDGSTSIMLKLIGYAAKKRLEPLSFLREIFWPGRIWACNRDMPERPPCLIVNVHLISLVVNMFAAE